MTPAILCKPSRTCDDRNRCIRYRAEPLSDHAVRDFSAHGLDYLKCMGFLVIYDTDRMMPEDWQESDNVRDIES